MAPRKQTSADGTSAPTPDGNGPELEATSKKGFDWAALAAPVAMPNKLNPGAIKVDVLATVPEPIRQRVEVSLAINAERVAAKATSTATRPRVDYHWECQPVTDEAMGAEFAKLATKYAKYRPSDKDIPHAGPKSPKGQITVRCGNPGHFVKGEDGVPVACSESTEGAFYGVRYSARPFEQRQDAARVPGTA